MGGEKPPDLRGGGLKYFLSALDVDVTGLIKEDAGGEAFEERWQINFSKKQARAAENCRQTVDCSLPLEE